MTWLFDQPFTIAAVGGVTVFFLAVGWVQSGRNAFLYAAGGMVALTLLLLIFERRVVSDREAVEARVHEIAAMVESNDSSKLGDYIVRSRPELVSAAKSEFAHHKFNDAHVTKIHRVEVLPRHQPPQVTIEFNAMVQGDFFGGQLPNQTYQRWVRAVFWKEDDGQWRLASYEHDEPTRFMKKREPGRD